MNSIPAGWIAWAAMNTAAGTAAGSGALQAGLGPVAAGAVTLAFSTRALLDLNAVYGPVVAAAGPAAVTGLGVLGSGHSGVQAAASIGLAVLAQSARKAVKR